MKELWIVGVLGGGAGVAFGAPLLLRGRTGDSGWSVEQLTGLWLLGGAIAMLLIGMRHGGLFPPGVDVGVEHLTNASSLVAWTALVTLTRRMAGAGPSWPNSVGDHLILPAIYVVAVLATGVPNVRFLWLIPVGVASVGAIGLVWRDARANANVAIARQTTAVFAFAILFCAAQTIRALFPRVTALREIVPVVMTLSFFAIGFALARRRVLVRTPTYSKSGLTADRAHTLVTQLDAGMREGGWYRDCEVSLASLASRLGVTPQALSQALNQQRKQSLVEYLGDWRLREAKRLLHDPSNDCYTVEGLARDAGFASRSAFYKAFRQSEGVTPAQFRNRRSLPASF